MKSWIIAKREWNERVKSKSFILMAFIGPLIVLGLTFLLIKYSDEPQQKWNILVADPSGVLEQKIMPTSDQRISYSFANNYIETEEFAKNDDYSKYDALLEVNEKVVTNKTAFLFYKEKPSVNMMITVRYQLERRLEEIVAAQFTKLTFRQFRAIKQPLDIGFRDVYDPKAESDDSAGWVGMFFGTLIVVFILLFGMTVLRTITREKSNRIVEVILASTKPSEMMWGKVIGIGLAALVQFIIWFIFVLIGLWVYKSVFIGAELSYTADESLFTTDYYAFIELIYERINFGALVLVFSVLFILSYFFYAAFFAVLGATSGTESDGQQFLIPVLFLLFFALYSGYLAIEQPDSSTVQFLSFLPFTSPVVMMVKFAQGYVVGTIYQFFMSICILAISAFFMMKLAGRWYKNGLLHFGHNLTFKQLIRWFKK